MNKLTLHVYLLFIFVFAHIGVVKCQDILQVVEKKVEKNFEIKHHDIIKIIANKAEIKVKGWEKENVKLVMKFTATHRDRVVAQKEIQYAKYSILKETDGIEIQNTFIIPSTITKINSIITVSYEVWMPYKSDITITNNYGDVSLTNLESKFNIDLDLGNIFLENTKGVADIHLTYGDITASKIKGKWNYITSNSTINIEDAEGSYYFHSAYGKINLSTNKLLDKMEVAAGRTEVVLSIPDLSQYNLNISTNYAEIITFNEAYKKLMRPGVKGNLILKTSSIKNLPLIKINTSYSPIIIKKRHN